MPYVVYIVIACFEEEESGLIVEEVLGVFSDAEVAGREVRAVEDILYRAKLARWPNPGTPEDVMAPLTDSVRELLSNWSMRDFLDCRILPMLVGKSCLNVDPTKESS